MHIAREQPVTSRTEAKRHKDVSLPKHVNKNKSLHMAVNITPLFNSAEKPQYRLIVVDPAASHLAYAIVDIDHTSNNARITSCGMVWTKASWSRGQRYSFMLKTTGRLISGLAGYIDGCVTEAFFANPRQLGGSAVVPTINAFLEVSTADHCNSKYLEIGASSWRSILGIKGIKDVTGKKDFKVPAKLYVESKLGAMPEKIKSNIDLRERNLPNDVTDCLAITLAYLKYVNVQNITLAPDAFDKIECLTALGLLSVKI